MGAELVSYITIQPKIKESMNRRMMVQSLGIMGAGSMLKAEMSPAGIGADIMNHKFSFCLNTSTIMGQKLGIVEEIKTAARAGYDGIEIWIRSLDAYIESGGQLRDIKSLTEDEGIRIENAIGFAKWIVDDDSVREEAFQQAKREMDMLAQVGCMRIAAPPAGATDVGGLDLEAAGARFAQLVLLGEEMGVIPQLEVWGFSKNLHKLSQVLFVAAECGHAKTRILPDVYHLFKGGSDFDGLKLLDGEAVEIFHMNDYPDHPDRAEIGDKDRVYPGDGVAPVSQVLQDLHRKDSPIVLSLELFNRTLWEQDAKLVADTGLKKMKSAVQKALS